MYTYHAATMTELHQKIGYGLAFATADEVDTFTSIDTSQHNVMAVADSMVYDFNFKDVWVGKARWSMMLNQYLDAAEVREWVQRCTNFLGVKGRGTAVLRTKLVKPRGGLATGHTNRQSRKWGSCMLSISYKCSPRPTITLHSRTSYVGFLSNLDFGVAWALARELTRHIPELKLENIQFVWMTESVQWHSFKCLPWLLMNPDIELRRECRQLLTMNRSKMTDEQLEKLSRPAIHMSRLWLDSVRRADQQGKTYGDMKYNTYRRIRRRYHTELLGYNNALTHEGWSYWDKGPQIGEKREFFPAYKPLPDCWMHDLTLFSTPKLAKEIGIIQTKPYEEGPDEDEDDE